MDEMHEVILEYVIDEYVDEDDDIEVHADTPLISSGIVDSFSMVSLKAFLEKKYDIRSAGRRGHARGLRHGEQISDRRPLVRKRLQAHRDR
jgi:acyl carrier protein